MKGRVRSFVLYVLIFTAMSMLSYVPVHFRGRLIHLNSHFYGPNATFLCVHYCFKCLMYMNVTSSSAFQHFIFHSTSKCTDQWVLAKLWKFTSILLHISYWELIIDFCICQYHATFEHQCCFNSFISHVLYMAIVKVTSN